MYHNDSSADERAIIIYKQLLSNLTTSDLMHMGVMRHFDKVTHYPDYVEYSYTLHILGEFGLPEVADGSWNELCSELLKAGITPGQHLLFSYEVPDRSKPFVVHFNTDFIYAYCERNGLMAELEELHKQGFGPGEEEPIFHIMPVYYCPLDVADDATDADSSSDYSL